MSELTLEQDAATQLQEAGFLVEREVRLGAARKKGGDGIAADLLAWAGDESGELVPEVVVEVKAGLRAPIDLALAQLSRVAVVMGARRAFFFDGRWHEADPTFTRFEDTGCPTPERPALEARVPRRLIEREILSTRDESRGQGRTAQGSDWIERILRSASEGEDTTLSRLCRGGLARLSLARILSEHHGETQVPTALTDAMVRLLAPAASMSVLDPACGLGGVLWAVKEACPGARLEGWWPNASDLDSARSLSHFCEASAELAYASFDEILAKRLVVDAVISIPPFSLRLRERVQLRDGSTSSVLDAALLDRVSGWLSPGGRAVVVVPPRLLSADSAAPLRQRLANDLRVVAVVELPSGVLGSLKIPIAIVVLERRPPTETLVARLRADWESQLSPSGDFFLAYQRHLKGSP